MNLLQSLANLFKNPQVSPENQRWLDGYLAFEEGKKHFCNKDGEKALDCFDRAIESGIEGADILRLRGICLQELGFDLDAIDDFNKAISLSPEDANCFFMRSLSRSATGDRNGSISDLQEAIRVSMIDNEDNRFANNYAKETGWASASAYYEERLNFELGCARTDEICQKLERLGVQRTKKNCIRRPARNASSPEK
jgi:tetratricopeptide (TPR) repeat protein